MKGLPHNWKCRRREAATDTTVSTETWAITLEPLLTTAQLIFTASAYILQYNISKYLSALLIQRNNMTMKYNTTAFRSARDPLPEAYNLNHENKSSLLRYTVITSSFYHYLITICLRNCNFLNFLNSIYQVMIQLIMFVESPLYIFCLFIDIYKWLMSLLCMRVKDGLIYHYLA